MRDGIQTRRGTRAEYDRLIEIGFFHPRDRVELLGGERIVSEPPSEPHFTAIGLIQQVLSVAPGAGWVVRPQGPIALDDESEPEPDIAVVPGTWRDYGRAAGAGRYPRAARRARRARARQRPAAVASAPAGATPIARRRASAAATANTA